DQRDSKVIEHADQQIDHAAGVRPIESSRRLYQQQEPWGSNQGQSRCQALRFTARKSARTAWQERRNFQHINDPLHESFGIVTPDTESNVSLDRHMRKERFSLRNVTHLPVTWTDVRTGSHVVDRGMVDDDS